MYLSNSIVSAVEYESYIFKSVDMTSKKSEN